VHNCRVASAELGTLAAKPLDVAAKLGHGRRQSSAGTMTVPNTLAAHPCFKTLDPESCRILDRHCVWLKTPAGFWILGQTEHDRDVYFIMTGRLRAVAHGARQDVIFTDMEAGAFFGELSAFDGAPRALSVFAVNDSLVAKMPSAVFVETMFSHRPLCEAVVATLIARLRSVTRRVGELGVLDVRGRLHAELLRLARPDREDPKRAIILAPPNQSELASRINTRRETVSREINAMERQGLVERRRGAIVITDALRLSARLEAAVGG
jgi:CRP/FNR family transcriptional regulator, cyclic AMP receptor protein